MKTVFSLAAAVAILLGGCSERDKKGKLVDIPTAGSIKIAVDESLKPLLEAEVSAFEGIYSGAHITTTYIAEEDAIDALLKDSVRLVAVTRKLTKEELAIFGSQKIVPRQMNLATDAVALILNRDNPDSLLKVEQLKGILQGKITRWNEINKKSKPTEIKLVFDHPNSGIIRFLNDSVVNIEKLPPNCFAINSNDSIVDYVSKQPGAIGLIGVGWISDRDNSTANKFLKRIRVAHVSRDSAYLQPFQAYIALRTYPLCRSVVIISREARTGLASGFIAFMASDKGQRIVLKAGLVPATMPVRIVEINRKKIE